MNKMVPNQIAISMKLENKQIFPNPNKKIFLYPKPTKVNKFLISNPNENKNILNPKPEPKIKTLLNPKPKQKQIFCIPNSNQKKNKNIFESNQTQTKEKESIFESQTQLIWKKYCFESQIPKSQIPNPKSQIPNPKSQIPNPKSQTQLITENKIFSNPKLKSKKKKYSWSNRFQNMFTVWVPG